MNDQFSSPVLHTTVEVTPIGQPGVEEEIKQTLLSSQSRNKAPYFPFQEHAAEKPGSQNLLENVAKQEIMNVLTAIVANDSSNIPGCVSMETSHSVEIAEPDIVPTLLSRNQEDIVIGVLNKWTSVGNHTNTNIFQNVVSEVIDSQKHLNFTNTWENNDLDMPQFVSIDEHRKDVDETMIPHQENHESGQLPTSDFIFLNISTNEADMDDLISFNPPVEHTQGDASFSKALCLTQNEDVLNINFSPVNSNTSNTVSLGQDSSAGSSVSSNVEHTSNTKHIGVKENKVDVDSLLLFTNAEESSTRPQHIQPNEVQQINNPSSIVPVSSQLNNVLTKDGLCEQFPSIQEGHDIEQVTTRPKPKENSAGTGTLVTSKHSVHKAQEVDQVVMRPKAKMRTDPAQTAYQSKLSPVNKRRPESMLEMSTHATSSNRLSDIRKSFTIENKSLPPLRKLSALRPLSASTSDLSRLGGEHIGRPASGSFAVNTFTIRNTKIDYSKTRQNDGSPFQVDVLKGIVGIGIKVKVTSKGHVQITEIQSGGPVEKNGHVRVGDYLLFVGSTEMTGQTDARVQQVLRLLPRGLTKLVIGSAAPASITETRPSLQDRNSLNVQHVQRLPQESHTTPHTSSSHTHIYVSTSEPDISEVKNVPLVKPTPASRPTCEPSTAEATEAKATGIIEITHGSQAQSINLQPQSSHVVERPKPAPRHSNTIRNNYETPLVENTSSNVGDPSPVETETNVQVQQARQDVSTITTHRQGPESSTDRGIPHPAVNASDLSQLTADSSLAADFIFETDQVSLQTEPIPLTTQSYPSAQSLDVKEADTVSSRTSETKETTIIEVKDVDKVSSVSKVSKETTVKDFKEADKVSSRISETKETTIIEVKDVVKVSSGIIEANETSDIDVEVSSKINEAKKHIFTGGKEIDLASSRISESKDTTFQDDTEVDKASLRVSKSKDANFTGVKEVKMYPRISKTIESPIRAEKPDNGISPHQTVPTKHAASTNQPNPSTNVGGSDAVKSQRKISAGYERLKSMTGTTMPSSIIEKSGTFVSSTAKLFDQKAAGGDEATSEQISATRRRSSQGGIANSDVKNIINTPLKSIKERWKSTENIVSSPSYKQPELSYLRTRSTSYSTLKDTNCAKLELPRKNSECDLNSTQINAALSPRKTSFDSLSNSTQMLQTKYAANNEYQTTGKYLGSKKETVDKRDFSQTGKLNLHKTGHSDINKSTSVAALRNKHQESYSSADHGKGAAQQQYRKPYTSSVQSSIPSHSSGTNEEVVDKTIRKLDELLMDPPYQRTDTHPHDLLLCFPEVKSSLSTAKNASREKAENSKSRDFDTVNNTTKLQEFVITLAVQGKPKASTENLIPGHKTDKSVITKVEIASLKCNTQGDNMSSERNTVEEQQFKVKDFQRSIVQDQGSRAMKSVITKIKNNDDIIQRDEQSIYSVELSSLAPAETEAPSLPTIPPPSLPSVPPPSLPSVPPPPLALRDSNLLVNVDDLENLNASLFVSENTTGNTTQGLAHDSLINMSLKFPSIQLDVDTHAGQLLLADQTIVAKETQASSFVGTQSFYTTGDIFHERDDLRAISPSPVDMLSEDSGMPADEDQEVATDDAISPPGELAETAFGTYSDKNVLIHSDIEAGILSVKTNTRPFTTRTITHENTSKTSVLDVSLLHRDETYSANDENITDSEDLPPPLLPSSLPPSVASINISASVTDDIRSDQTSSTVQTLEFQSFLPENNLPQSEGSFVEKQEITRELSVNKTLSKVRAEIQKRSGNQDTVPENVHLSHITIDSNTAVSGVASITRPDTAVSGVASITRPDITKRSDPVTKGADSPHTKKSDSIPGLSVSTTTPDTISQVLNRSTKRIDTVTQSAELSRIKKQDLIPDSPASKETPNAHSEIREKAEKRIFTESITGDVVHVPDHAVPGRALSQSLDTTSQSLDTTSTTVTSKRKWCLRSNVCKAQVLVGNRGVPQRLSYAESVLVKALSYSDLADVIGKANSVLDVSSAPDSLLLVVVHLHGNGAPLGVELKHQGGTVFRVSGIKKGSPVFQEGGAALGDWLVAVDSLWCDNVTVMRFLSRLAKPKQDSVLVFAREETAVNVAAYQVEETILIPTRDRPTANKRHTSKVSEQENPLLTETPHKSFVREVQPSNVVTNVHDQSEALALKVSPLLEEVSKLPDETPPLPSQPPPHQVPQFTDQTQPCTRPESQLTEQAQPLLDQPPMVKDITPHSDKTSCVEQEMSPKSLKQPSALVQEKLTKSLETKKSESILTSSDDTIQVKQHPTKSTKVLSQELAGSEIRRAHVKKANLTAASANSSEAPTQRSSTAVAKKQEEIPAKDLSSAGPTAAQGSGVQKVMITKGATGIGFCLEGGLGSPKGDLPITIKRIFKGGPAEKCGLLKVKDEILEVNGVKFSQMGHYEAWNHLKFLDDGEVHITIRRT